MTDSNSSPLPAPSTPEETICLDRFLKLADIAGSGGQAKYLIQSGAVAVNGQVELRRGRKLRHGDTVTFDGEDYVIETSPDDAVE
ncbi:MAG: RNA-binding S4 domain-containing protein [Planctomycetaceae bacterium]